MLITLKHPTNDDDDQDLDLHLCVDEQSNAWLLSFPNWVLSKVDFPKEADPVPDTSCSCLSLDEYDFEQVVELFLAVARVYPS